MIRIFRRMLNIAYIVIPSLGDRLAYLLFCRPWNAKVRRREQRIRNDACHESSEIDGKLIKQLHWGESDKRALLVHGWASNGGSLGGFVTPLTEAGYQVMAFDGPAHGESEGHITNIFEFAAILSGLLKKMDGVDLMITHSFGSAAAVLALAEHPGIHVPKLVMVTAPNALDDLIQEFTNIMKLSKSHREQFVTYLTDQFDMQIDEMMVHKLSEKVNVEEAMLLHDPEDKVLPFSGARRIAEEWQSLTLVPVENKGHYRILWDSDIIREVLTFIKSRNPTVHQ